ncbi:MAG: DUF4190 domain-containing protein [Ruminococcaceae bacterium]|nr:DUF4190 domain-containing protein [Oscillospiraceae bacterium]
MNTSPDFNPFSPVEEMPAAPQSANGWAIASLIFGVLSLVICTCCCGGTGWIPLILGAVAIILAIVSRKGQKMSGVAIGGLVCGIIAVVLALAVLLLGLLVLDESILDQILTEIEMELPEEFYQYIE